MKTLLAATLPLAVLIGTVLRAEPSSKTAVVAVGVLQPMEVVDIGAQVAGKIEKVIVDYGAAVKAGDVLAQLDAAPYRAEVDRAQAGVERAQAKFQLAKAKMTLSRRQLERLAKLRDTKAVDESELETAKAELEVAEAALRVEEAGFRESKAVLQRAQLGSDYCTLRSPIEGVVIDRRCTLGQTVTPSLGSPSLFIIARDLKKLQVWASVKEGDIARVAAGQSAKFKVDAFPGQTFQGRVAQVRLNATTKKGAVTYTVTIDVDNQNGKLLPYMTAEVSIAVGGP